MEFPRKAIVTVPSLSFKGRLVAYVHFLSEMHTSEKVAEEDDGREPATTARVVNLETGELVDLICPTLLVSALDRYQDGYIGKSFEVRVSKDAKPGKRYRDVQVFEVQNPADIKAIVASALLPAAQAVADAEAKAAVKK